MTRPHPPGSGADVAGDRQVPLPATPVNTVDREAERGRLAEDLAWLVHRWIRLEAPPRDRREPRGCSDVSPRS